MQKSGLIFILVISVFTLTVSPVFAQGKVPPGILKQVEKAVQQRQQQTTSPSPTVSPRTTPRPTVQPSPTPAIIDTLPEATQVDQTAPAIVDQPTHFEPRTFFEILNGTVKYWRNDTGQYLISIRPWWMGAALGVAVVVVLIIATFITPILKQLNKPKKFKIKRIDL